MDLSGPRTILAEAMGLMVLVSTAPQLTLARMMVGQLVDRLKKRAMEAVGKGKSEGLVPLSLVDLENPPLKISVGLVEGLILDSCLDKKLLAKQFYLN